MEWGYLWLWGIMAGVFLVGEIFTAAFFLFWFGVAAGVTAIVSLFGVAPTWQLATFVALSLGLLMISRPFAERDSGKQPAAIGANRFVGEKCQVLEDIDPDENTGRVRLGQDELLARLDQLADPANCGVSPRPYQCECGSDVRFLTPVMSWLRNQDPTPPMTWTRQHLPWCLLGLKSPHH